MTGRASMYDTINQFHDSQILDVGQINKPEFRELPDNQAGFTKERGTRDHIANMRWIMERQLEYGKEVHICFIDYSKAFDCINHELLWKTLLEMGIPKHLI